VNGVNDANTYTVTWDGKNDRGGAVASGIYFYKMDTKDFSQTKKMVMLR
jgi:flagellar hook assembly protein FlgD